MREIKFRGFCNIGNKMYDKFYIEDHLKFAFMDELINSAQERYTLMQFTGLKDKNGVEIYEGDVIECKTYIGQYKAVVCFGEYNQDGSGDEYPPTKCIGFYADKIKAVQTERDRHSFDDTTSIIDSEFSWIKVIGNIYENPELLKGG